MNNLVEAIEIKSEYVPGPKQCEFHSSPCKYKIVKGGLGSGKTRMAVEEVSTLMLEHQGLIGYVMRKTMPSLRDSTLHELKKFIDPQVANYNGRSEQFNYVNGSQLRCRGLDEPWKIKSTEVAVIVLDEADEFTLQDFITLKGRLRQVNRKTGQAYPLYMILIFNPVPEEHWIYQQFVNNAQEYDKDGGILLLELSTYDNEKNLPTGYVQQVSVGLTPDEVEMWIWGRWGKVFKGEPVYAKLIKEFHFKKWQYKPGMIIKRGWDFGFNHPACIWRLQDHNGRKNIDQELLGSKEDLDIFAKRVLHATEVRYGKNILIQDYCDPRGHDKSDKGQSSVDILNELGIYPIGERGVRAYVEPGIKVVRKELSSLIEGEPELTINPECVSIKAAYGGKYSRDEKTGEPVKDGFFEHLCDADRYIAYNDRTNSAVRDAIQKRADKRSTSVFDRHTGYGRLGGRRE